MTKEEYHSGLVGVVAVTPINIWLFGLKVAIIAIPLGIVIGMLVTNYVGTK